MRLSRRKSAFLFLIASLCFVKSLGRFQAPIIIIKIRVTWSLPGSSLSELTPSGSLPHHSLFLQYHITPHHLLDSRPPDPFLTTPSFYNIISPLTHLPCLLISGDRRPRRRGNSREAAMPLRNRTSSPPPPPPCPFLLASNITLV
ncbi:hypothetical protein V8E54_002164 [Elaphomyces granulatus]